MTIYYWANRLYRWRLLPLARICELALFLTCGTRVPCETEVGAGRILAHGGNEVVIHPRARIGSNVIIHQQVTIGGGAGGSSGVPVIEDDVYLGAGCKILGDAVIGHDLVVGANSMVLESVPPGSVVAGVPARLVRSDVGAHSVENW